MNHATLIEVFGKIVGATKMGIDTLTVPVLLGGKKNPQQGRIKKRTMGSRILVAGDTKSNSYENDVNRGLIADGKEPTFKVGERSWGEALKGTGLVVNGDKSYAKVLYEEAGTVTYELDGVPIDKKDIIGLQEKKPKKPDAQGGVSEENQAVPRTLKPESILEVRAWGNVYR